MLWNTGILLLGKAFENKFSKIACLTPDITLKSTVPRHGHLKCNNYCLVLLCKILAIFAFTLTLNHHYCLPANFLEECPTVNLTRSFMLGARIWTWTVVYYALTGTWLISCWLNYSMACVSTEMITKLLLPLLPVYVLGCRSGSVDVVSPILPPCLSA